MPERLFTIVCEFRGGTYVSQVRATDERDAVGEWTKTLGRERPFKRASRYLAKSVAAWSADFPPVALTDQTGVWFFTGSCGGDLMVANIIDTATPADPGCPPPTDSGLDHHQA